MFIYLNEYIEKIILETQNQRASLSFLHKNEFYGEILTLILKIRKINAIFEIIKKLIIFVKNFVGG